MAPGEISAAGGDIDYGRLLGALRENRARIVFACMAAAVVAFALTMLASPEYRAETRILIEARQPGSGNRSTSGAQDIASQIAIIGSTDVLKKVAEDLHLGGHEAFRSGDLSLAGRLMVMAGLRSDPGHFAAADRILRKLRERLEIYRVPGSSIVAVCFSSHDPALAANVPNAIADAYLAFRSGAKREPGMSAADWLKSEARVVARASRPDRPYFPRIAPITATAFAASLLLTVAAVLLVELVSGRAARRAAQPVATIPQVVMPVALAPSAGEMVRGQMGPDTQERPGQAGGFSGREPGPAAERAVARLDVGAAAETLMTGSVDRAVFVSAEGGAAAAVPVARMVAASGLRTILVDLTVSGVASVAMLETTAFPGIGNFLVSEAQFHDVIRGDLYSDCHVVPVGTVRASHAMHAADRLPIIVDSLAAAYDVVVVECGRTNADALRRLAGAHGIVMVSAPDPDAGPAAFIAQELAAAGLGDTVVVTRPAGRMVPSAPRERDAA